jgi:hypothetical protein
MTIDILRKHGHTRVLLTLALSGAAKLVPGQAQQLVISTYAGGPSAATPIPALNVAIGSPQGITADASGNLYFTSLFAGSPAYYHGRYGVFKLDRNGSPTRVAGNTGDLLTNRAVGQGAERCEVEIDRLECTPEYIHVAISIDAGGFRLVTGEPFGTKVKTLLSCAVPKLYAVRSRLAYAAMRTVWVRSKLAGALVARVYM